MNRVKAVFFDIDGTLVPLGHNGIPHEVKEAIARVRDNGVKVFISTGRHPEWIDNLGDSEFDGYVTVNGGMCLLSDRKTCIYKKTIDPQDIDRLISFSGHSDLPIVVVPAEGGIFINRTNDEVRYVADLLHLSHFNIQALQNACGKEIVQLIAFGSESERSKSGLMKDILKNCVATSWNPLFCDIVPAGSDKSVGIDRMIENFGIPLSETMAFGDGDNDIGMLRHVAIGIAMGNAEDNVKKAADYVTTPAIENGVVNALRHFKLL